MILFEYFGNFEHFGHQYLTENPDKAESPLQKSGKSSKILGVWKKHGSSELSGVYCVYFWSADCKRE